MSQYKLGIFGGTFNPVHFGHLKIAKSVFESLQLTDLYFVPSYIPPHKNNSVINFKHRLAMLELALQDEDFAKVSLLEFERKGKSYTIDTLMDFQKLYPQAILYLIIGEDSFDKLPTWYNFLDIIACCKIVVIPRNLNKNPNKHLSLPAEFLKIKKYDISATSIRDKIQNKIQIAGLLPEAVVNYIYKHKLYQ